MDVWNNLLQGFITAGTPINLLWALVGCTIGTAVGVLPVEEHETAMKSAELTEATMNLLKELLQNGRKQIAEVAESISREFEKHAAARKAGGSGTSRPAS